MARHHCRRRAAQESSAAAQASATELVAQLAVITTTRTELQLQLDTAIAEWVNFSLLNTTNSSAYHKYCTSSYAASWSHY
jgi:hypothetical protein